MADDRIGKPTCVVGVADAVSAKGRDPFAAPGTPGNRWMKLGCDASIPPTYLSKLNKGVHLAYRLNERQDFIKFFVRVVSEATGNTIRGSDYLDALNRMEINSADGSMNPFAVDQLKRMDSWAAGAPGFALPGGFTKVSTGTVWTREFALRDWNEKQLAGLLMHESTHVLGAPGDDLTEAQLAILWLVIPDYAPPEN